MDETVKKRKEVQLQLWENLDSLVERTPMPKSWWYSQLRLKGPGRPPAYKAGRYWLFIPEEIDAWLKDRDPRG